MLYSGSIFEWDNYPTLFRYNIPGEGSCFFTSVIFAYCKTYRKGKISVLYHGEKIKLKIDRQKMVSDLRIGLANKLTEPVQPRTDDSDDSLTTHYQSLANGNMEQVANDFEQLQKMTDYNLEVMKKNLSNFRFWPDQIYVEYVSNILDKDIYILEHKRQDIYMMVDVALLWKNRQSVVLLYNEQIGHFETIGLIKPISGHHQKTVFDSANVRGQDIHIETCFEPDDPFIIYLRERYQTLKQMGKNRPV